MFMSDVYVGMHVAQCMYGGQKAIVGISSL